MKKKLLLLFSIFGLFTLPKLTLAQGLNAGFVSGIWYSSVPFFAGEQVRVYASIQNQSEFDLIGTIRFYDNDKVIGEKEFTVISGRLIETWADWVPDNGDHSISAKIINPQKVEIGKDPESIELIFASSAENKTYVDIDPEGDEIETPDTPDDDNSVSDPSSNDLIPIPDSGIKETVLENSKVVSGYADNLREDLLVQLVQALENVRTENQNQNPPIQQSSEIQSSENLSIAEKALQASNQNQSVAQETEDGDLKKDYKKIAYEYLLVALVFIFERWWLYWGLVAIIVILALKFTYNLWRRWRWRR